MGQDERRSGISGMMLSLFMRLVANLILIEKKLRLDKVKLKAWIKSSTWIDKEMVLVCPDHS